MTVSTFPRLPLGTAIEDLVTWISTNLGWLLDGITDILTALTNTIQSFLSSIPPPVLILIIAIISFALKFRGRSQKKSNYKRFLESIDLPVLCVAGLLLIWDLDLWDSSMETLALVIVSTIVSLVIGIPIGIIASHSDRFNQIIRIFLDFMQTMPSFVYLIPAVIFFGLGNVPGVIATVVFAMPPTIRLTNLGIRQIPKELIEVSDAFGATMAQKLIKVELPVALPTIMAGVNQCIMLALSMTVIASMIGAGGLGYQVLYGIQRVDIGSGFEAGLAIVIIAIILDRLSQNLIPVRESRRS
ncbi:proline/glycine betaine ABC transporter permease [Methanospirillum sp. J.3.6.1-F.2.7.3]|uniref:Proline/glycine betaine ABC transporter permease n=1 Tax=Methanospirillum purgamenti TaxID=2834276 RepID=A0A8E7B114_9EURY|nr:MULTISPECIES: proline/glycine betaine ABC transporter permease [Methanospirillum]MDX8551289.1 proline/glycine betaine ABC transporter permease [Methanospirillum hungatei]QVV88427.1 proline/glycine betaine ABC transporter permease [Methanospirillum sp. J.3.6.1-F.2.7.3]